MALSGTTFETLTHILVDGGNRINNGTVIRFRKGDILSLVVEGDGEDQHLPEARTHTFVSAKGTKEVSKFKFLLKRGGASFPVYITLGTFISLPIAKRGFESSAMEDQRNGANNAIFADFEMRSAEAIISNLRKGVVCDRVFTTTESSALCYRWLTI